MKAAQIVLPETPDKGALAIQALHDAAVTLTYEADKLTTVREALALHTEIERALAAVEYASGLAIDKADSILKGQS